MAEKPSKSKAKVRKSSTDKKSSKADTSKKLKELNENLNQEKDVIQMEMMIVVKEI